MSQNKLETIANLFEDKEIRSIWDSEKEEYYFSVIDVISCYPRISQKHLGANDFFYLCDKFSNLITFFLLKRKCK